MSLRVIKSILWRDANKSTLDTLEDKSQGQYHVALTTSRDVDDFFNGSAIQPSRSGDGTRSQFFNAWIEAFEGPRSIPKWKLPLTKMGDDTERGEWRITSQRKTTAYPLWRPERAFPDHKPREGTEPDGLILVRDADDRIHARWVRRKDVHLFPDPIKQFVAQASGVTVWANPLFSNPDKVNVALMLATLLRSTNVLLYGPPATGKTRLLGLLKDAFATEILFDTCEERQPFLNGGPANRRTTFVTFHESYAYEDFVVGLRPEPTADAKSILPLRAVPGAFLEASEFAREGGRASLLMIDEINRGSTAKAFGEVITLLDADKRLDGNGNHGRYTVEVRLPYRTDTHPIVVDERPVPHPYTMPLNVFMVATMNAADKSVAPLDAALRRRFHVEHVSVDVRTMLQSANVSTSLDSNTVPKSVAGVVVIAARLIEHLNTRLAEALGPDYEFGHGLIGPVLDAVTYTDACEQLRRVWRNRLFPQLEEHFVSQPKALAEVLGDHWAVLLEGRNDQNGRSIVPLVIRQKIYLDATETVDALLTLLGMQYGDAHDSTSDSG